MECLTAEKREGQGNGLVEMGSREYMTNEKLNELGGIILDASIEVHKQLGAGLFESAYQLALCEELRLRGINYTSQVQIDFSYKGKDLGKVFMIDILIENEIVVELKAVESLMPIHQAQLITYLKLSNRKLGYLINFNVELLKQGFKRIVYKF